LDTVALAALAAGLRCAAAFAAGLTAGFGAAATGSGAGGGAIGSGSAGIVLATPMVLDSVRWHVSHVTIVRTSVPS
jgi:hypothetical protein